MKKFVGFEKGIGVGGWLTNFKRYTVVPADKRLLLTIGDEEHFEKYITRDDIAYIASLGMDHIRLAFDQFVMEPTIGAYRERSFELLDRCIDWCHEVGLNVNLNMHKSYGNYCDVPEEDTLLTNPLYQERFITMWLKLEDRYADRPYVAFELLNEMRYEPASAWNAILRRTVAALREKNKDRIIIVGGNRWNCTESLRELEVFDDENVVYTFHFYDPIEFTHQRGVLQDRHVLYNRDMPYPGDISYYRDYREFFGEKETYQGIDYMDIRYLRTCMQAAFDFVEAHPDKILYCGEFSVLRHVPIKWRENWLNDVIKLLKELDAPYCVWNYLSTPNDGNKSSLVDDDHRKILSERLRQIINGNVE